MLIGYYWEYIDYVIFMIYDIIADIINICIA